jgi:phosphate-selective porin OprO/OprP
MNKKFVYSLVASIAISSLSIFAAEKEVATPVSAISAEEIDTASTYDKIWDTATTLVSDSTGPVLDLALTGRLQGDAYSFRDENRSNEDIVWRRFRFGAKAKIAGDITLHSELDLNLNNGDSGNTWDDFYNRLTDTYIAWSPSKKAKVKVGKQSAGFTLDGATSSKKLIVPERNIVSENMWFGTEYFTGASLSGDINDWSYKVGGFSASGEEEFGHFDNGYFGLLSAGHKIGNGTLRLDYVYNDAKESDKGYDNGTRDLEHIVALVHKTKLNDKIGIWSDIAYATGMDGMSDLFGGSIKPFYNITDEFQLVFEYAGVTSLDNDAVVNMSRYAARNTPPGVRRNKGETVHNLLAGFNWYLYGHKLKWHNAVEYNYAKNINNSSYGVTSAIRISW